MKLSRQATYDIVAALAKASPFSPEVVYNAWHEAESLDKVLRAIDFCSVTGFTNLQGVVHLLRYNADPVKPA